MAVTAQGTTLKFTPQGGEQVTVGKVISIGEIGGDSQEIDVTTLDSQGGYREYAQGYKDAGSLAVQGYHDKSDAGQAALQGAFDTGKAGAVEIAFSDGAKATFSAYVKRYALGAAKVDGAVGFSVTLRITGKVSYTTT